jgi:hypothetical protein
MNNGKLTSHDQLINNREKEINKFRLNNKYNNNNENLKNSKYINNINNNNECNKITYEEKNFSIPSNNKDICRSKSTHENEINKGNIYEINDINNDNDKENKVLNKDKNNNKNNDKEINLNKDIIKSNISINENLNKKTMIFLKDTGKEGNNLQDNDKEKINNNNKEKSSKDHNNTNTNIDSLGNIYNYSDTNSNNDINKKTNFHSHHITKVKKDIIQENEKENNIKSQALNDCKKIKIKIYNK